MRFVCGTCLDFSTTSYSSIVAHNSMHTGVRPEAVMCDEDGCYLCDEYYQSAQTGGMGAAGAGVDLGADVGAGSPSMKALSSTRPGSEKRRKETSKYECEEDGCDYASVYRAAFLKHRFLHTPSRAGAGASTPSRERASYSSADAGAAASFREQTQPPARASSKPVSVPPHAAVLRDFRALTKKERGLFTTKFIMELTDAEFLSCSGAGRGSALKRPYPQEHIVCEAEGCGYSTIRRSDFNQHRKRHHTEKPSMGDESSVVEDDGAALGFGGRASGDEDDDIIEALLNE